MIDGNVKVPDNTNCFLLGTTVLGNVQVGDDSRLTAQTARITGNVQGNKVRMVSIFSGSEVGKNVMIKKGESTQGIRNSTVHGNVSYGESGSNVNMISNIIDGHLHLKQNDASLTPGTQLTVTGNSIGDQVQFDDNAAGIDFSNNTVDDRVKVFKNTGGVSIVGNTINGDLDCKHNDPPPVGGGNVVSGQKKDQCAAL